MNEDRSTRYHRLKRQFVILGWVWTLLLLGGLTWTGWSVALRDAAESAAVSIATAASFPGLPWVPALTVLIYVLLLCRCSMKSAVCRSGCTADYVIERRYGLSNESLARWVTDEVKSLGIGLLLGCGGAALIYFLIRLSPDWWWLGAGALFTLLIVGLTNLAPALLLPLFYTVKPLDREALRVRLLALAERAGARVLGAYEWGLSAKDEEGERGARRHRRNASDPRVGYDAGRVLGRRNRGRPGARAGASRSRRHLEGNCLRKRADARRLLSGGPDAGGLERRRRACVTWPIPRGCRCCCWPRGRFAADDAGRARHVARAREERRPFCARPDEESAARSFPRCDGSARRTWPKSIRRRSCSGCSTATRRSASASPRRRRSRQPRR